MARKREIYLGDYTITLEGDRAVMTGYTGWSDCGHSVTKSKMGKFRAALGMQESDDLYEFLKMWARSTEELHQIFIENAWENFSWWDPDDWPTPKP